MSTTRWRRWLGPSGTLVAFARVAVGAGSARRLAFTVPAGRLGFTGRNGRFVVEPGAFTFLVGASSVDIRAAATVVVDGHPVHSDPNGVPPFPAREST